MKNSQNETVHQHRLSTLFVALLFFCVQTVCWAQKIPVTVEVGVSSSMNRSGGPIPLTVYTHYFGSKAGLAGNLTFDLISTTGTRMATYQFEGLFLTKGEQTWQFLIQPPTSGVWEEGYDMFPIFTTDSGKRYRLPEQLLRLPGATRRACVITVASAIDDNLTNDEKRIASELAFESRMPGNEDARPSTRSIITLFRGLSWQNFPNQPLDHCVSDIVLLQGEALSRLNKKQCAALLAWVKAGGSLAIFLDETEPLTSSRMQYLNELLDSPQDDPLVYQLSSGKLQFTNNNEAKILFRETGIGRVALAASPKSQSLKRFLGEQQYRQLYIHLWKVRKEQAEKILASRTGEWSFDPGRRYTVQNNRNFGDINDPGLNNFTRRFRSTPTGGGNALLEKTLPTGMEMVPLWLIGFTLFLYILAIGPGDYLLLGAMGIRKYTWIFFPVVTVLFTAGAIVTANYKMQGNDDGGRIIIRDISANGEIVRENEISTYVPTTGGEKLVDAKRELLTPINPQQLGVNNQYLQQRGYEIEKSPPVYRGRFPVEAQLVQQVHKWSPEMVRRVRIPSEPTREGSGFDWTQPINPRNHNERLEFANRLKAAFGEGVNAKLIRRNGRDDSDINNTDKQNEALDHIQITGAPNVLVYNNPHHYYSQRVVNVNGTITYSNDYDSSVHFLKESALREEAGVYSVVSQLSPKCDDFLEDLPVLDPTDDSIWLLLITVQNGNDWDVYRQLIKTR